MAIHLPWRACSTWNDNDWNGVLHRFNQSNRARYEHALQVTKSQIIALIYRRLPILGRELEEAASPPSRGKKQAEQEL